MSLFSKKEGRFQLSLQKVFFNRGLNGGFSIVELLVVIAVLGIIMSIGLVAARTGQERARDAERKVALEHLRVALELYRDKNGVYPSTGGAWYSSEPGDLASNNSGNWIPGLAPIYISTLPRDPRGGASKFPTCGSWLSAYSYRSTDGTEYTILAHCSPERPIVATDPYHDPNRSTYAYKVCSPGGCNF